MKKKLMQGMGMLAASWVCAASLAYADAAADSVPQLLKDIEVHGFASSAYNYALNKPSDATNRFRAYDTNHNSFKFDVGELVLLKEAKNKGDIGFRTDLNYGFSDPRTNAATVRAHVNNVELAEKDFDVQQAFVSYNAPIGNGLQLSFGKFITHVSAEVMNGYDGFNYNYSRSWLFNYGPFTHTGMRGTYAFNNKVAFTGMIVNGWDNQLDKNEAKSLGAALTLTPWDGALFDFHWVGGPETQATDARNSDDWRNIWDFVSEVKLSDSWLINTDMVYGYEDNAVVVGKTARWWGMQGILRNTVNKWFAMNYRAEYYSDKDGFRTGHAQNLWEFTITPELRINNNMVVRAEYRHDHSDRKVFDDHGKAADNQDTIALNALFYF